MCVIVCVCDFCCKFEEGFQFWIWGRASGNLNASRTHWKGEDEQYSKRQLPELEGLRQGTFSFVVLLRSSVCLKDPHWNTTDDERRQREKNEQNGFKGSSTGPPGEEIPRVPLRDLRGEKIKIKILKKLKRAHTIEKNT